MVHLYRAAHLLVRAKARVPNDSYKLLLEQSGYKSRVDRPEPKMGQEFVEGLVDGQICHDSWSVQVQRDMNDTMGQKELGCVFGGVLLYHITPPSM